MFVILILLIRIIVVFGLVGGKNVSIHQAPFQANYADVCGAVIIHVRWTLTTAHCGAEGTFIRAGSANRLAGIKIQIQRHIIHPKYIGQGQFDYDIQLLKLYKEMRFGRNLRSVVICKRKCGGVMQVFGWGYEKEKGDFTTQLQTIEVQRVSKQACQNVPKLLHYQVQLTSRMFCAKGFKQDACQGDSGGAAVSSSGLIGLSSSSFGYGCGRSLPGVYVSVTDASIRRWIKHLTGV